jgi:hypothetical protein
MAREGVVGLLIVVVDVDEPIGKPGAGLVHDRSPRVPGPPAESNKSGCTRLGAVSFIR